MNRNNIRKTKEGAIIYPKSSGRVRLINRIKKLENRIDELTQKVYNLACQLEDQDSL
jgi:hypothetical protein